MHIQWSWIINQYNQQKDWPHNSCENRWNTVELQHRVTKTNGMFWDKTVTGCPWPKPNLWKIQHLYYIYIDKQDIKQDCSIQEYMFGVFICFSEMISICWSINKAPTHRWLPGRSPTKKPSRRLVEGWANCRRLMQISPGFAAGSVKGIFVDTAGPTWANYDRLKRRGYTKLAKCVYNPINNWFTPLCGSLTVSGICA